MLRALLVCIALMALHCKAKPIRLEGTHDTPQTAFELAADKTMAGTFSKGDSTIFIRVKLNAPAMFRAELTAARGADSSITVFSPPEQAVVTADDNGSSLPEEISPVYLAAGVTLVRIQAKSDEAADFQFFYRVFNAPSDVEREPNSAPATANALTGLHATGFHGPLFTRTEKEKLRERDCFSKQNTSAEATLVSARLTGVEGITGVVSFLDAAGNEIHRQEAAGPGQPLDTSPVFLQAGAQLVVCVSSARLERAVSRDYYDLNLVLADITRKSEIEPNNSAATASRMTEDTIAGQVSAIGDVDYFTWVNRKEYPVLVNVSLEAPFIESLRLAIVRKGEPEQLFENSAVRQEIAENIRLEAGEQLTLGVLTRAKLKKKDFKPLLYTLKINESQFNDDSETEPNDTVAKADVLIDHAQKWGFLNPVGDVDYYRLKLDAPVARLLVFESKIACKVKLEHLRGGKSLAISSAQSNLKYSATFETDDLLKIQCVAQKPNPAERAYRLALVEQ